MLKDEHFALSSSPFCLILMLKNIRLVGFASYWHYVRFKHHIVFNLLESGFFLFFGKRLKCGWVGLISGFWVGCLGMDCAWLNVGCFLKCYVAKALFVFCLPMAFLNALQLHCSFCLFNPTNCIVTKKRKK